ncbi:GH17543 [Drosophila grimshawi]|uniref:GH17543 n=1 Tax=Drosophila grimshawi TaxID=7222 RepID=B4K470_DROGR|nr:GH17543 [Drosophila grimshawi]
MWSNALCTLGVTKPLCSCLSIRQVAAAAAAAAAANQNAGAAITTGPTAATNAAGVKFQKKEIIKIKTYTSNN